MTLQVLHSFVSTNANGADTSLVQKAAWNGAHVIQGITPNAGDPNGVVSGTVGDLVIDTSGTGKLWQNTTGGTVWAQVGGASSSPMLANGIDGALNFDGSATVLGLAPTGSTPKIYTLTRDIFPSSMLIGANVSIDCANFVIFCTGTITGASQTTSIIHNGGKAAAANVAGTSKAAGRFAATLAGGNGVNGAGAGAAGSAVTAAPPNPYFVTQAGGTAGTAGAGSSTAGGAGSQFGPGGGGGGANLTGSGNAGGAGGGVTASVPGAGYGPNEMISGRSTAASVVYQFGAGGAGGGAALTSGSNPISGGGGSGAGCVLVAAAAISTCTIHADGGDGAAATAVGVTVGSCGGGGGGGGGCVVLLAGALTSVTARANGGAAGAGAQNGAGASGKAGGAGAPGRVIQLGL